MARQVPTYPDDRNPRPEGVLPELTVPADAAQWIRAIRSRRRLSQRELARLAGVPVSTVSRIEAGTADPRFTTFLTLFTVSGHEIAARDSSGLLVMRDSEPEAVRDRGDRHPPAHLRLVRTPGYMNVHYRDWWGWDRIAFWPGHPAVPEWTYWRDRPPPRATALRQGVERGYVWDDAT